MRYQAFLGLAAAGAMAVATMAAPGRMPAQDAMQMHEAMPAKTGDTVLKPADTEKLLPEKVYYHGQSAPAQLRNSGGVKFADGFYLLATMVDTSGYASDVAAKYQIWLVTEVPIKVGGQPLPAGVYGLGFLADTKFLVTDVGGHDVLTTTFALNETIRHPLPLQVLADPAGFRLYSGRKYVVLSR